MNQLDTTLMNFRIPVELKDQFNQICEYKNINMSYQLKLLIKSFIDKETKKQIKQLHKTSNTWSFQKPINNLLKIIKD